MIKKLKMRKLSKRCFVLLLIILISGIISPSVNAATSPSLGNAITFGILSSTYTNTLVGTTINGDLGYTTGPVFAPTVAGITYTPISPPLSIYNAAGTDQAASLAYLNAQACTFTFAPGAIDLATDTTHGPIGVYTPGIYCTDGAASIGTGGITLDGVGAYIFRITGALTTVANSVVTLSNGASSCNLWWTPTQAITLGADSIFKGGAIADSGITFGDNVVWEGRALAFGGTVTTNSNDTITVPTCAVSPILKIVKTVINDSGRTKTISDFPLFVGATSVISNISNTFNAGAYTISETNADGYSPTFGGDCTSSVITLANGDNKTCTISNDDDMIGGSSNSNTSYIYIPTIVTPAPVIFIAPIAVPTPIVVPIVVPTPVVAPIIIPLPVVVAPAFITVPGLPKTGINQDNNFGYNATVISFGIIICLYFLNRKYRLKSLKS